MMTYADGFHSHSVIGITFVVASASMSALYKVSAHLASLGVTPSFGALNKKYVKIAKTYV